MTTGDGPLPVTVVVPAHDRAGMVGLAVRSALDQHPRPPAEVLVVDDASSDTTADEARAAGARVVRLELNQGPGGARNAGLAASTQPWIAFLDSDDEWAVDHLERLWPERTDVGLVAAGGLRTDLRGPRDVLVPTNPVMTSGVLARRQLLLDAGAFDASLRRAEDLDLWVRALERSPGRVVAHGTVRYRTHADQLTTDVQDMFAATRVVAERYAGRPWAGSDLLARVDGARLWDELRTAQRAGDARAVVACASAMLRPPTRLLGVGGLLAARARHRRAASAAGPAA